MQQLERLLSFIAPHHCIGCGTEGQLLCEGCLPEMGWDADTGCAFCGRLTSFAEVCAGCRTSSALGQVWALGLYEGLQEALVCQLKFSGVRAAHLPLAKGLDRLLPQLRPDTIVVPLPTAPQRVRQRGFDHTVLIAKEFARQRQLRSVALLQRRHNERQVGASRAQRQWSAAHAYVVARRRPNKECPLLLIDDVLTTGASLKAAASVCQAAGFNHIMAAVIARQPFKG